MRIWTPIKEGRFDVSTLDEPWSWKTTSPSWWNEDDGPYHEPVLVDCDLWGTMVPSDPPLRSMRHLGIEEIAAVFGMFAATPEFEWVVPTRNTVAMCEWFKWVSNEAQTAIVSEYSLTISCLIHDGKLRKPGVCLNRKQPWPLPNVTLALSWTNNDDIEYEDIEAFIDTPSAEKTVLVDGASEHIEIDAVLCRMKQTLAIYYRNCTKEVVRSLKRECRQYRGGLFENLAA